MRELKISGNNFQLADGLYVICPMSFNAIGELLYTKCSMICAWCSTDAEHRVFCQETYIGSLPLLEPIASETEKPPFDPRQLQVGDKVRIRLRESTFPESKPVTELRLAAERSGNIAFILSRTPSGWEGSVNDRKTFLFFDEIIEKLTPEPIASEPERPPFDPRQLQVGDKVRIRLRENASPEYHKTAKESGNVAFILSREPAGWRTCMGSQRIFLYFNEIIEKVEE
jgi:hypothetical protein